MILNAPKSVAKKPLKRDEYIILARQILTVIALFLAVAMFTIRVVESANKGIETKKRSEMIAAEIQKLEQENADLRYKKELYSSSVQQEAEYRALESKKKEGEKIFIISRTADERDPEQVGVNGGQDHENQIKVENWKQWRDIFFNF